MKWLLRGSGFYWPDMIIDCFTYYQVCQKFGHLQLVPITELHHLSHLGDGGLDFVGDIHPSSSKGHQFVLSQIISPNGLKCCPKNMTHREVIEFLTKHIIHRFDIAHTFTTN
jgi:hypothetical protein